jgi:hypothetical protein
MRPVANTLKTRKKNPEHLATRINKRNKNDGTIFSNQYYFSECFDINYDENSFCKSKLKKIINILKPLEVLIRPRNIHFYQNI